MTTFYKVMVTPAVCPRLFVFLTTLTFGALRRTTLVSTAFEATTRKKEGPYVHLPSAVCLELSRTQPKFEGNVVWKKNKISRPWRFQKKTISVIVHKLPRRGFISTTVLINSNKSSEYKYVCYGFIYFENNSAPRLVCNHFRPKGVCVCHVNRVIHVIHVA